MAIGAIALLGSSTASAATYAYDGANRLVSAVSGSSTVTYSYDGEGALVAQCVNGTCTAILTSGKNVVGDSAGNLYAYGPTGAASVRSVAGVTSYPATDHHGSVLATVSPTGAVASRSAYDVFGNTRATAGAPPTLGYDGEYTGDQGQTVWLRARAYSPAIGRFLQRDSFVGTSARPSSLNRYSYAENRPANLTDPSGFDPYYGSALQNLSDLAAGFGSAFGTDYINHWLGNDDVIQKCSGFHAYGRGAGIFALGLSVAEFLGVIKLPKVTFNVGVGNDAMVEQYALRNARIGSNLSVGQIKQWAQIGPRGDLNININSYNRGTIVQSIFDGVEAKGNVSVDAIEQSAKIGGSGLNLNIGSFSLDFACAG